MTSLRQAYALLSPSHRRGLLVLATLMLLSAIFEMAGIASIMPFMSMVADPGIVDHNHWLSLTYHRFGFDSPRSFMIFLGFVVLGVLFLSNLIAALTVWSILRFSFTAGRDLAQKMFSVYLNHPYVFFLNRNSSELVQNTLFEMGRTVNNVLIPLLTILARSTIALSILILLFSVNPSLALVAGTLLGGAYGLVYFGVRKTLARSGQEISRENARRTQVAYETFGGIKDIKILGREKTFFDLFQKPVERYALLQAQTQMISLLPRYALETMAFGGIIGIVLYLLSTGENLSTTLPLISLYALAGYRLMPALQQIFANWSTVRFNISAVERISRDIEALPENAQKQEVPPPATRRLSLQTAIELDRVTFHYPGREEAVLDDLSLVIPARTSIGLVGSTGSGKTTTLDILLGLLEPTGGSLKIDGQPVNRTNVRQWQATIGYVPQQIMLLDDTVLKNIAFGIPEQEIDRDKVVQAATLAHLHDFVTSDLREGYDTPIGERGVRLSGGQRQRIGIARALYHEPSVLVLDEATSALDNITENVIMEALNTLARDKTVIMVAHRLTTVRECDTIVVLDRGRVVDSGTYDALLERNDFFRMLAPDPSPESRAVEAE
ncbi:MULTISPECIES: ABC transporter ATP-binding protein [Leptospirillum]|jgi:ABC-type multidrug transport system fused ATPase/permease subunit|uniref:ABC transporter ATP-binding protein n=3 Tax=Leptospirillum ferriphilum TaxID=178606 RepID=A0A059XNN6_9BACT|nr:MULTISPECIES: ABC transporter ATP-binding protein [Leptospirillum]EAY57469.1 MAG: putative ABC transporter, ATP-binding protein [Leptospirillum rubarum]EIJ76612.1 MAG: Putative ABC transporter, ATP-binding protein [Leptospirillum sp. Group II 'C75']AFS52998.1 ABC-type multidrug transport system, ATPase and permease component [Leptospirillum ferriphilum ML-04]AIA30144.1 ABC transporter ATP-binding protein [Leptospirillum ferriphilum YSK]AKS23027.1 ABC transporter ATP-binding protein [Leptosp